MRILLTAILSILLLSCEAQFSSPKKLLLSYYGDSTVVEPTIPLACPNPLVIDTASVGTFQMSHSLVTDGTYIYVGERISNTDPTQIARIIKYNPTTLTEVSAYNVGPNMDVENMVYDNNVNRIYATQIYDDGVARHVVIMRINPTNMSLIDTTVYTGLITTESFAIVTDNSYIYGVTHSSSPQFFKIRISDMALVATNEWTNGERGHAARINTRTGFMYVTDIPYSAATDVRFAKISLSDLSYTEVNIGAFVRKATDDFALIDTGDEVFCFVGSEYIYSSGGNAGYGGVKIKTSDMSLTGMSLKTTYAIGESGDYIYNATIDGNIQIFHRNNLSDIATCNLNGFFGNEFISLGGYGYITNFEGYNKSKGKLIKIGLIE